MTTASIVYFTGEGGAQAPLQMSAGASGFDLVANEEVVIEPLKTALVRTGISLDMTRNPGLEAQVRSRSGLSMKHGIFVLNGPGTIDNDYTGEIKVILANVGKESFKIEKGMRIAQLVFNKVEQVQLVQITEADLMLTERGNSGFGSTGI